eukprot:10422881-Alexandrium_andersonii.AAC.1
MHQELALPGKGPGSASAGVALLLRSRLASRGWSWGPGLSRLWAGSQRLWCRWARTSGSSSSACMRTPAMGRWAGIECSL